MLAILHLLGAIIANLFKSQRRLEAENLFLRHQLNIALRRALHRPRLRDSDRAVMVWLTGLWPSLTRLARVVEPDTILRWHRAGFRAYWRWKSRGRPGRPKIERDAVYGDIFIRRLQAMGIRDRPIAARSPWQNGYAERLILAHLLDKIAQLSCSIRRDCLDYVVVFGERHLRHLLESYQRYYNEARTHLSLSKDAPAPRAVQAVGSIIAKPFLGGLHHQYVRI